MSKDNKIAQLKNSGEADKPHYVILLVEDQIPDKVMIRKQVLELWPDAEIVPVTSISEAYETYKQNNFNLILLDLNLPDSLGPNTVHAIRQFSKSVPIVVLTGLNTDITVSEALKLGANHVALKSQLLDEDFKNILNQHVQAES
ncbi:MAG: response regulator [Micavibrio sp.]|nr:response regulator [Micavibrio sp.]